MTSPQNSFFSLFFKHKNDVRKCRLRTNDKLEFFCLSSQNSSALFRNRLYDIFFGNEKCLRSSTHRFIVFVEIFESLSVNIWHYICWPKAVCLSITLTNTIISSLFLNLSKYHRNISRL